MSKRFSANNRSTKRRRRRSWRRRGQLSKKQKLLYKLLNRHTLLQVAQRIRPYVAVPDYTHTQTHTHFTTLFPGLPGSAGTRKVKPIWILLKQETVSGSGISWAICKSAPRSRQITTPTPHRSVFFLQAGCPSYCPTNSVKALKADGYSKL